MNPQQAPMASEGDASTDTGMPAEKPVGPRQLTAESEPASPEEQALYEKFVSKAFMLVYDKKFFPTVLDLLQGEGDPIEGLALASSKVIARVMKAAQQGNEKLPGDVLFHAAKEVFEDLAELSRRAGIKDFSADPDALEGAYFRALDHLRIILEGTGDINREAAQADLAMLQQMDEAGELENLFRDLAMKDEAAGGGSQQEAPMAQDEAAAPQRGGLMPKGAR